ncbi:hypothetical protein BJ969_005421 [Saccharopolyspora gloriosae]|uniref:Uncharacterized protein n=1 Tax=Saccharopolyspora gloriosae TaxID=455344 RepID=A0A840NQM6_9PSEU|nr:hypothetical protein [Saccharopolyspora gloriosae]MBB5072333.1 hypothetical protein [Saccharopolyspora gloriosae]
MRRARRTSPVRVCSRDVARRAAGFARAGAAERPCASPPVVFAGREREEPAEPVSAAADRVGADRPAEG